MNSKAGAEGSLWDGEAGSRVVSILGILGLKYLLTRDRVHPGAQR